MECVSKSIDGLSIDREVQRSLVRRVRFYGVLSRESHVSEYGLSVLKECESLSFSVICRSFVGWCL